MPYTLFLALAVGCRKHSIATLLAIVAMGCIAQPDTPSNEGVAASSISDIPNPPREFRGVWIATVGNIDWPSRKGLTSNQQQSEMRDILDKAKALRLNAIVFQVRPACDALYVSQIEPWSASLTGIQGKAPEPPYDPLQFAIEEAHKRGLELHAWFNPYRAGTGEATSLAPMHIGTKRPDLVKKYGKYLWLDPGEKEVQDYTLSVILDVVKRYDIDGVHFDDYFYPYKEAGIDFPDDPSFQKYTTGGGKLDRDSWRRSNVDSLVQRVSEGIKQTKPQCRFGISPFGIWRPGYPAGVSGLDSYGTLYADSRKWFQEGWVDYLAPQLYWPVASTRQPYGALLKWWSEQNKFKRHLWPGNFTSKIADSGEWTAKEIVNQIEATRKDPGASGNIHFSAKAFMHNQGHIDDTLSAGPYQGPALVPACPWLDNKPPAAPAAEAKRDTGGNLVVSWRTPTDNDVFLYAIYAHVNGAWRMDVVPGSTNGYSINTTGSTVPGALAVSAIDRAGNESSRSLVALHAQTAAAR